MAHEQNLPVRPHSPVRKDLQAIIFDSSSIAMALPFPEGVGFFGREGLRSEGYYNANNSKGFYNYFIIEYLGM